MFRGLLILTSTVVAVIAMLIGVVGFGLHKIAASEKEADAAWRPPDAGVATATTHPSVEPVMASDAQAPAVQENASIELWAKEATLHGDVQLVDKKVAARGEVPRDERAAKRLKMRGEMGGHPVMTYLSGFNRADDYAEWIVELPKAGEYEIDMTYASPTWNAGGHFVLAIADKELRCEAQSTRYETNFRVVTLGKLLLPAGKTTLTVRPAERTSNERLVMNVRNIHVIPASD
ncbi:MAG TPA: hypothetical protein VG326_17420 [Tepidisphaeraceae bacterium]|nr:hypothetical protein [Tepidisphaeraceae bacterium]